MMRKKLPVILIYLAAVCIALTVISINLHPKGNLECYCQSEQCIQDQEDLCESIGADHAGWRVIFSMCEGSTCVTWYDVICEGKDRLWYTRTVCEDECGSWCDT